MGKGGVVDIMDKGDANGEFVSDTDDSDQKIKNKDRYLPQTMVPLPVE